MKNNAKLKEMPSNGSYITYSLIAPRDSTYLLARLKYLTQQIYSIVISKTLHNIFSTGCDLQLTISRFVLPIWVVEQLTETNRYGTFKFPKKN